MVNINIHVPEKERQDYLALNKVDGVLELVTSFPRAGYFRMEPRVVARAKFTYIVIGTGNVETMFQFRSLTGFELDGDALTIAIKGLDLYSRNEVCGYHPAPPVPLEIKDTVLDATFLVTEMAKAACDTWWEDSDERGMGITLGRLLELVVRSKRTPSEGWRMDEPARIKQLLGRV